MIDVKKILVTGGARSGKSGFAQDLAYRMSSEGRVLYIATAKVFDWEMEQRVKKHRESRPATWDTYEGYQNLADVIRQKSKAYDVILLDCVTVMLTNLLFDHIGEQDPDTLQKSQTDSGRRRRSPCRHGNHGFGSGIYRTCCLIQNENIRFHKKCPADRQQLLFSGRKA